MSDTVLLQVGIKRHAMPYTAAVYPVASDYSAGDIPRMLMCAENMPMRYSLNLKPFRQRAKFTQQQLAEKVGVEQPTIQRWEAGKQKPSLDDLDKLAGALGVHPGELFRDEEFEGDPQATEAAIQHLAAAAIRSAAGNVPASSVRPIVRGLSHALALLLRNPAIRTNPDALAVAVHALESQSPEASLPS